MAQAKKEKAKPKPKPKFTDKAQSERFIEAARKGGVVDTDYFEHWTKTILRPKAK
jgi:hypothetical protein